MLKKKKVLNIMMILTILIIVVSGIMTVGTIKGWFQTGEETGQSVMVTAENKTGGVNIERSGIAYALDEGAKLRDGDLIQTLNGSAIDIVYGTNRLSLSENSEAILHISDEEICVELTNGEIFVNASETVYLQVLEKEIVTEKGVFAASVPYGSAVISVFENQLLVADKIIKAGEAGSILENEISIKTLTSASLNDFYIAKVKEANANNILCFSNTELKKLEDERELAKKEALEAKLLVNEEEQEIAKQREQNKEAQKNGTASSSGNVSADGNDDALTCTITIRCDTILNNMDELVSGKNQYVPANGCILATSRITFEEGETVFDVLQRACSLAGIQLEYAWTPIYNSYYIEGINHLYEFDCGGQSGWMYKVNGWFPNYGCSSYNVNEGDAIVFCYTCRGLGEDVGGSNW